MQILLNPHDISMRKSRGGNSDNWWFLLLPDGTVKIPIEKKVKTYIIRLPDGFRFFLEDAIFKRNKAYARLPRIYLEESSTDAQN